MSTAYTGTAATVGAESLSTGAMESGPSALAANWLATVDRRVRDSIAPDDQVGTQPGQWLTRNVANSAIEFFEMASNYLPGEPYIYSSNGADLIADFKTKHGMMTVVVSASGLSIYATVNGMPQGEKHIDLRTANPKNLQTELQPLAILLSSGKNVPSLGT